MPSPAVSTPETLPCILVILDGLGDRPHPDLGGRTPLEAARTPYLDGLAGIGALGSVMVVGEGVAPESDAGVLSLLGYDPEKDSPGRGVLEAEGAGLSVRDGEVAFRFNFATVDAGGRVVDQRVGRSLKTHEAQELARTLTQADLLQDLGIRARFHATVGHRGVLHLAPGRGEMLSPDVTNSDPFYEKWGGLGRAVAVVHPTPKEVRALSSSPEAERTARAVNRLLERVPPLLKGHPTNRDRAVRGALEANHVLLRDAGTRPKGLATFREKHGLRGAAITEMPVERGIARILGLTDIHVGPVGGDRKAALAHRAAQTRDAIRGHEFVYVHLKGPDEPGHDGDAIRKKDVIEELDRDFFGPFLEGWDHSRIRLAVTADHATPCVLKGHSDDPVPLLLVGGEDLHSSTTSVKFCERTATAGSLGVMRGRDLIPRLCRGPRGPRQ